MKKAYYLFLILFAHFIFAQSDCTTAIPVCGNSTISYTPSGFGVQEIGNNACGNYPEAFSVWYSFTVDTAGTLTFIIDDQNPQGDDYDFFLFGPNVTCGTLGAPIRCSTAGGTGDTGLNMTSVDLTEQPGGDRWVKYLDVLPGETYYLCVNNWSQSTHGFLLTWGGTATLQSPFNNPLITPHPFVPPGNPGPTPDAPREVIHCALPGPFDFTTLTAGILNGNANFVVTYHDNSNDAITGDNPLTTTNVNATTEYYYRIHYQDPSNPDNPINKCFQIGKFKFKQGNIEGTNQSLLACNNNGEGKGKFDLTSVIVYPDPLVIKKYYPSATDLANGTNEILTPTNYISAAPKDIYVKLTTSLGCTANAIIHLQFYPVINLNPVTIESCFIEENPTTAKFDLTSANITNQAGPFTKKYYPSLNSANNQINEITNPNNFISTNTDVYVRVTDENSCYAITKITLKVIPPKPSTVLQNRYVCIDGRTTLDAGPGYDAYEWSTGASTQTISGVGVGAYWVKLRSGYCITMQKVYVYVFDQPVITGLVIKNNTITVNVSGGTAPYQYSIDGVNWQPSSTFNGLPRGETTIYVKDANNCQPISTTVTVPNLVNAITPNGDNVNDYLDYSALSMKKNLTFEIYDRYGNKVFTGEKFNNYRWDGKHYDKKLLTGTYWYTITWNENDAANTFVKYDGWILIKNRD